MARPEVSNPTTGQKRDEGLQSLMNISSHNTKAVGGETAGTMRNGNKPATTYQNFIITPPRLTPSQNTRQKRHWLSQGRPRALLRSLIRTPHADIVVSALWDIIYRTFLIINRPDEFKPAGMLGMVAAVRLVQSLTVGLIRVQSRFHTRREMISLLRRG